MDDAAWTHWLAEPVRGRKIVVGYRLLAGTTQTVRDLARWGARRPLVISVGRGTGTVPEPDSYELHTMYAEPAESMTAEVRRCVEWAADPPAEIADAVAAYDPEGEAVWWARPIEGNEPSLGRQVLGGRPAAWAALEDKLLCDDLWDAAGVPRAPARTVALDATALRVACAAVDRGAGTVWSGDARDGLNGGNDFVRWVRDDGQRVDATEFFAARCDRVRVMPYLAGTACSIHGFVLPDGVAAFRPVELVQLPDPGSGRFAHAGLSTWWDPPEPVREAMRDAVRVVGRLLAERVGYRGGFGIDGVLTEDGFLPTELNPRFSAGMTTLARAVPELPIELAQINAVLGRDVAMPVGVLERRIVDAADRRRAGRVLAHRSGPDVRDSTDHPVLWRDDRLTSPPGSSGADAVVSIGPSMVSGGLGMLELHEPVIAPGESALPYARALDAFAASLLGDTGPTS